MEVRPIHNNSDASVGLRYSLLLMAGGVFIFLPDSRWKLSIRCFLTLSLYARLAHRCEQYPVLVLWAIKILPHHLHLFWMSILLLIFYPFNSPIMYHGVPLRTMTYQFLYNLSNVKLVSNKRVTNTVQKWAEKGLSTIIIAEWTKIKGVRNERLTNQWWLMLIVCKYILLTDAVCVHHWLSIA